MVCINVKNSVYATKWLRKGQLTLLTFFRTYNDFCFHICHAYTVQYLLYI